MKHLRSLAGVTDAELISRSRRSPDAFRALYDRHVQRVHRFLLRRTGEHGVAFELTAEVFARAWLSRGRFVDQAGGSAAPWLLGIARNVLADTVRKHTIERAARERLKIRLAAERPEAYTEERIDAGWLDGLDDDLAAALAELSDDQRRAVEMRVLEEREYDDVGRRLGCSSGAARLRVFRALGQLRERLNTATTGGNE